MPTIDQKLNDLHVTLPDPPAPIASYLPAVQTGNLLIVSGQLPFDQGQLAATGPVPSATAIADAQTAARQCILNGLSILKDHLNGDWSQLIRVVRIGVFVQSDIGFDQQAVVANGASDFLQELFGEIGRHARAAVGVNALPLNASVEIELTFELAAH